MKEYDEIKDTASTVAEDSMPKAQEEKRVNPTWEAFQKYKFYEAQGLELIFIER
jgi:hypothetical protein